MNNKEKLTYNILDLYYIENLTQESIARRLKISKYKVNRILKEAKKNNMVQIKIVKPG